MIVFKTDDGNRVDESILPLKCEKFDLQRPGLKLSAVHDLIFLRAESGVGSNGGNRLYLCCHCSSFLKQPIGPYVYPKGILIPADRRPSSAVVDANGHVGLPLIGFR